MSAFDQWRDTATKNDLLNDALKEFEIVAILLISHFLTDTCSIIFAR